MARAAREAAEVADEDEYAGLPDDFGVGRGRRPRVAALADWSTERKVELALEIERAARAREGITQVENAVYSDAEGSVALVNSRGFAASYSATQAWAYASAFAGEGADLMTGMGVGLGPRPGRARRRGRSAARPPSARSRSWARASPRAAAARWCSTRSWPPPSSGSSASMLSADAVQRGRSLFAGREGEEVADSALALADDGTDPEGPASAPFDGEGSPTRRTPLIEGGRLHGFLYDARTARKAGRRTTGNASRGSYRAPPSVGLHEPGGRAGRRRPRRAASGGRGEGLYVTDVAGLHSGVNPVSGTFSVGASGRLIEDGELGAPVREMTIASDLVGMLKAVRAVGSEGRWVPFGGSVKAAPILIGEMAVSGS